MTDDKIIFHPNFADKTEHVATPDQLPSPFNVTDSFISNPVDTPPPAVCEGEESPDQDKRYAKQNLKELIDTSMDAFNKLCQIANASEHPRAFEVLAKMMDSIASTNLQLLEIEKEEAKKKEKDSAKTVNNTMFIGTTEQMEEIAAELVKQMSKEQNEQK